MDGESLDSLSEQLDSASLDAAELDSEPASSEPAGNQSSDAPKLVESVGVRGIWKQQRPPAIGPDRHLLPSCSAERFIDNIQELE